MSEKEYLIISDDFFSPAPEPKEEDGVFKAVGVMIYSLIGIIFVTIMWMSLYVFGADQGPVTEMLLRSKTIGGGYMSGFERTVEYVHILPFPMIRLWDALLIGPIWFGISAWLALSFPGKRSGFVPMWWMGLVFGVILECVMETFTLGADTIALPMSGVIVFLALTCIWHRPEEGIRAPDGAGLALGVTLPYALVHGVLPGLLLLAVLVPAVLAAALLIGIRNGIWWMFYQARGLVLTACAAFSAWRRNWKLKRERKRDSTPTTA